MDTTPVIAQALGKQWHELHPLLQRHYGIAPGSESRVVMAGEMREVHFSRRAAPLIYMARLFGALVAERASAIPVTVVNSTRSGDPAMHWHRTFSYPNGTQRIFESRMVYSGGNEIIEYVRFGLGIRMAMSVQEGALVFESRGFQWGRDPGGVRIPDLLLLGRSRIVERALAEEQFEVEFDTRHPLYGRSFGYNGTFRIVGA
ncbi:MAG TPA: DUF4166 domain-containing protein [Gammaproteobacteria bacterium]